MADHAVMVLITVSRMFHLQSMSHEYGSRSKPVISHNQNGVLWVESELGQLGLFDDLLRTECIVLVLC